eukprot:6442179-Prymnesium_polylepis.1
MPSAKNSLNVTGSATSGATSGGGYQRKQKSSKPGAPWMKTEVTCANGGRRELGLPRGGWGWGFGPALSSEWKTSELRHVGMATASGPIACAKLISSRWRDVGSRIWSR